MFADRLVFPRFVFAKSNAGVSVCLTNIASVTAWTFNFVYDTTGDIIWDLCLKGTNKRSDYQSYSRILQSVPIVLARTLVSIL